MGHTYASLLVHVIFSTKGRRPLIATSFRQRLYEYMAGVARQEFGRALTIGGTDNHIHSLLSIGTNISVGDVMSKWKSLSSGWVHKAFPESTGLRPWLLPNAPDGATTRLGSQPVRPFDSSSRPWLLPNAPGGAQTRAVS
ncbi:MAG TPA: transposase [Planctomycetota bacterium]|nr:transposase [Planctomycetota bacterium]